MKKLLTILFVLCLSVTANAEWQYWNQFRGIMSDVKSSRIPFEAAQKSIGWTYGDDGSFEYGNFFATVNTSTSTLPAYLLGWYRPAQTVLFQGEDIYSLDPVSGELVSVSDVADSTWTATVKDDSSFSPPQQRWLMTGSALDSLLAARRGQTFGSVTFVDSTHNLMNIYSSKWMYTEADIDAVYDSSGTFKIGGTPFNINDARYSSIALRDTLYVYLPSGRFKYWGQQVFLDSISVVWPYQTTITAAKYVTGLSGYASDAAVQINGTSFNGFPGNNTTQASGGTGLGGDGLGAGKRRYGVGFFDDTARTSRGRPVAFQYQYVSDVPTDSILYIFPHPSDVDGDTAAYFARLVGARFYGIAFSPFLTADEIGYADITNEAFGQDPNEPDDDHGIIDTIEGAECLPVAFEYLTELEDINNCRICQWTDTTASRTASLLPADFVGNGKPNRFYDTRFFINGNLDSDWPWILTMERDTIDAVRPTNFITPDTSWVLTRFRPATYSGKGGCSFSEFASLVERRSGRILELQSPASISGQLYDTSSFRYAALTRFRVWLAGNDENKQQIAWTNLESVTTLSDDAQLPGFDPATGVAEFAQQTIYFQRNSMHAITGSSDATLRKVPIPAGVGSVAHATIAFDPENYIMYFLSDKGLYAYDGGSVRRVQTGNDPVFTDSIYWAVENKFAAAWMGDSYILACSFGSEENDRIIAINPATQSMAFLSGPRVTSFVAASSNTLSERIFLGDADSSVVWDYKRGQDNNYQANRISGWYDAGDVNQRKRIAKYEVNIGGATGDTVIVDFYADYNITTSVFTDTIVTTGTTQSYIRRAGRSVVGRALAVGFKTRDNTVAITRLGMDVRPLGVGKS